jgi:hypothetical protein
LFVLLEINVIREFVIIICTLICTIITVFTFIRLKKTYLQPFKLETRKKQLAIITDFLTLVRNKDYFRAKLDYNSIIIANAKLHLEILKLVKPFDPSAKKKLEYIFTSSPNIKPISNIKSAEPTPNKDSNEYVIHVNLTKEQFTFYSKVKNFSSNPLLPEDLIKILKMIVNEIEHNYGIVIAESLNSFIQDFKKNKDSLENINLHGIANDYFYNKYTNHDKSFDMLFNKIHDYFLIND